VGSLLDPDGNHWMVATHMSEPSQKEIAKRMKAMMQHPSA